MVERLLAGVAAVVGAAGSGWGHPLGGAADGQSADSVRQVTQAELFEPSAMPDRVVLTWEGDPRTTQAVTWRTSTEVARGVAQIAEADHGPLFASRFAGVGAETRPFLTDLGLCHMHTARFEGLKPGTVYAYRVGDGVNWTEWFQFRTEPEERSDGSAEPFTFVYFGDAQNAVRSMWSRVTREAFRDAPRAAFFLHAGDLVNREDSDGEWGEWFHAGSFINATIPVIATPGNHEYGDRRLNGGTVEKGLTRHFEEVFAFPRNGPSGLEESVYYIDYGDARIISLNSNEMQREQIPWMHEVLGSNDRRWTIVTFHHPLFAMARNRNNTPLRLAWKPVLDEYGVDLVLSGHDHTYGRTDLVTDEEGVLPDPGRLENAGGGDGARRRDGEGGGTVYVVSVSGPKMYQAKPELVVDAVRRAEDTQPYQVITVDGEELRYEARTAVGALYDSFTLRADPGGGANELIEGEVTMAPRRR